MRYDHRLLKRKSKGHNVGAVSPGSGKGIRFQRARSKVTLYCRHLTLLQLELQRHDLGRCLIVYALVRAEIFPRILQLVIEALSLAVNWSDVTNGLQKCRLARLILSNEAGH